MSDPDPQTEPIVGLVVVSHGSSAECLLGAAAGLVGELPATASVTVAFDDAFDEVVSRVEKACDEVDAGVGIIILVDLHGSSPFQACLSMLDGTRPAEIVCGLNLPMLLKLATVDRRELRPAELAAVLKDVGRRSIRLGSELTGKVALAEPETGTR